MDPKGFRRCDGFAGSIPQNFINKNLPTCPLCGTNNPYWTLKDKMEFSAHRILFRCQCCGGVLSATQDDFTGATKSAAYMLTTAGLVNAVSKKKQGKDRETVYLRVEDVGNCQTSSVLLGQDLPLDEFQRLAAAFYAAPSQAPAPAADVTPLAEDQIHVSYGEPAPQPAYAQPQYAQPQPQYVPPQPQYAQPQPQYAQPQPQYAQPQPQYVPPQPQYAQPYYPQPAPRKPKEARFPVASLVLMCLAILGYLFNRFAESAYFDFGVALTALSFGTVFAGLFLYKKNLSFVCGIGCFLYALAKILGIVNTLEFFHDFMDAYFIFENAAFLILFAVVGLSFCLPKVTALKVLKIIACSLMILLEFVFIIFMVLAYGPFAVGIWTILYMLYMTLFYLALMLYFPVSVPKEQ